MDRKTFELLEKYMLSCMGDSAHDKDHIYRVLYNALDIAETELDVDYDVLICACLLHDIGRKEQFENSKLCHAMIGGEKAYSFLIDNDFSRAFAERVKSCIQTHRYRQNNLPQSIEAKILFDADKLDATGTIGIARTLLYKGKVNEGLYSLLPNGKVSDGKNDVIPSFFQEYRYKLENVYDRFYTDRGNEIAKERQKTAISFYNDMYKEVSEPYNKGMKLLEESLV
ncbi:MAG: HD domain-containing protein [Ruminococcus sp.]|nr:HD domain-containing protein [Ruminococcus sp.]